MHIRYPIQIVTNGLDQALLAVQKGIAVTLLGGPVKRVTHAIAGITAYQQLVKLNFDFAFIGMNGLSAVKGLTTTNIEEASLKECAMRQSQHIRILMDESKVGQIFEHKVDVPSQATILLNANTEDIHPEEIKQLKAIFDLQLVKGT